MKINNIIKKIINYRTFFRSKYYWEMRYRTGGSSGEGSYDKYAEFKTKILNEFIQKNAITKIIDFGCGDGSQISKLNVTNYLGFDVSKKAVEICKNKYSNQKEKDFYVYKNFKKSVKIIKNFDAHLAISLDVIFHLVEDKIFEEYIYDLFRMSSKFVIIYSSNFDNSYKDSLHQKDRKFTDFILNNLKEWELLEIINNPFKGAITQSDFFIFKRKN